MFKTRSITISYIGYSRRKHREPCRKVISFYLGMRVDRIYEHRIVWDNKLLDKHSEPYGQLSYESIRAVIYNTKPHKPLTTCKA